MRDVRSMAVKVWIGIFLVIALSSAWSGQANASEGCPGDKQPAEDGSCVAADFYNGPDPEPSLIQAEDGSEVPPSFYEAPLMNHDQQVRIAKKLIRNDVPAKRILKRYRTALDHFEKAQEAGNGKEARKVRSRWFRWVRVQVGVAQDKSCAKVMENPTDGACRWYEKQKDSKE